MTAMEQRLTNAAAHRLAVRIDRDLEVDQKMIFLNETRPQAAEFGIDAMRKWYRAWDQLGFGEEERIIPQKSTLDESVRRILNEAFGDAVVAAGLVANAGNPHSVQRFH